MASTAKVLIGSSIHDAPEDVTATTIAYAAKISVGFHFMWLLETLLLSSNNIRDIIFSDLYGNHVAPLPQFFTHCSYVPSINH